MTYKAYKAKCQGENFSFLIFLIGLVIWAFFGTNDKKPTENK